MDKIDSFYNFVNNPSVGDDLLNIFLDSNLTAYKMISTAIDKDVMKKIVKESNRSDSFKKLSVLLEEQLKEINIEQHKIDVCINQLKLLIKELFKENIKVIGTVFKKRGKEGDFEWQIKSGLYDDSLFIYNDDELRRKWKKAGQGNAIIRKYNKYAIPERPRSAGICTGSGENKGYSSLNSENKKVIDEGIDEIRDIISKFGYKKVYYSAEEPNGLLGTSIFKVDPEVLRYITDKIHSLSKNK
jgi:hypothetical protein